MNIQIKINSKLVGIVDSLKPSESIKTTVIEISPPAEFVKLDVLPPLTSSCCYNPVCWGEWRDGEPCYGEITVIDEDYWEDEDGGGWAWIHACEGHQDRFGKYEPYIKDKDV